MLAFPGLALPQQPGPFADPEAWAKRFDDPARDTWQKPAEVLRALALRPDSIAADIGAGTGYFAVRLARALPKGRVYAADIEPEMVRYLKERAAREGLANLHAVLAAPDEPRLPQPVDRVLLVSVYHAISDRVGYFTRLRAKLNPGAKVGVIGSKADAPMGPPRSMRLSPQTVIREMEQAGYTLEAEHAFLPYHHFLVFAPR
jgi:predicted methyltransferase